VSALFHHRALLAPATASWPSVLPDSLTGETMEKARRRHVPAFGEWNYYSTSSPDDPQLPRYGGTLIDWWYVPEPDACSDVWFRYSPPPRKPGQDQEAGGWRRNGGGRDTCRETALRQRRERGASEGVGQRRGGTHASEGRRRPQGGEARRQGPVPGATAGLHFRPAKKGT
jgi:hypothetical protein